MGLHGKERITSPGEEAAAFNPLHEEWNKEKIEIALLTCGGDSDTGIKTFAKYPK